MQNLLELPLAHVELLQHKIMDLFHKGGGQVCGKESWDWTVTDGNSCTTQAAGANGEGCSLSMKTKVTSEASYCGSKNAWRAKHEQAIP